MVINSIISFIFELIKVQIDRGSCLKTGTLEPDG